MSPLEGHGLCDTCGKPLPTEGVPLKIWREAKQRYMEIHRDCLEHELNEHRLRVRRARAIKGGDAE